MSSQLHASEESLERDLRYTARAGLLPELSRQTYDAFYKALREVVLNSLDAEASCVTLDFSRISDGEITVSDDGTGMSSTDVEGSFLSLGGSAKFGEERKFGRIGIGSLALLHYGATATIETKVAGSSSVSCARLEHPWRLDREGRSQLLEGVQAGTLAEARYLGSPDDHFTIIRLHNVSDAVATECTDVSRFYALLDRLRRVLPLPWPDNSLSRALEGDNRKIWAVVRQHIAAYAGRVSVKSQWGAIPALERRVFGEEAEERWDGEPRMIYQDIPVRNTGRTISVAAYFLSQTHASPAWAGLTSRVQNVAVEERTFFDVESDPGFRKYLTGEVFIFGSVDRSHLINIDRSSFNRECADYRAAQRFLSEEIVRFKAERIQSPRRSKVVVKRKAEEVRSLLVTARDVCSAFTAWCCDNEVTTVPSSGLRVPRTLEGVSFETLFDRERSRVVANVSSVNRPDEVSIEVARDGNSLSVNVGKWLWAPTVRLGSHDYRLRLVRARDLDPVIVRARPREVVLNLENPALRRNSASAAQTALLLELAYLLGPGDAAIDLYDRVAAISTYI
jgi:hypothetical protein